MIANTPEAWSARAGAPTPYEAAMWSARGQHERFMAVFAALRPVPGESLLDYGCGAAALRGYISPGVRYVGWDWSPAMRARARRDWFNINVPDAEPVGRFDLVACVGTFNLADNWSTVQTWDALAALWTRCDRTLAVCLYAGDQEGHLSYREDDVRAFAAAHTDVAAVTRHRRNDVLLVMGP